MCDCRPDSAQMRLGFSPAWVNQNGAVVHPGAPGGAGGSGMFSRAAALGADGEPELLPHPGAPAAGALDPIRLDDAQQVKDQAAVRKPAPRVTTESKQTVNGIEVTLGIDTSGEAGLKSAYSELKSSKPAVDAKTGPDGKWVTTIAPFTARIWTEYGSFDPESTAAYGRGTTDDDKKNGNVTLGFHESCHRADLLAYLKEKPMPEFTGKPEMKAPEMQAAINSYITACRAYFDAAKTYSVPITDEVGKPTKSQYKAANP